MENMLSEWFPMRLTYLEIYARILLDHQGFLEYSHREGDDKMPKGARAGKGTKKVENQSHVGRTPYSRLGWPGTQMENRLHEAMDIHGNSSKIITTPFKRSAAAEKRAQKKKKS